MSNNAPISVTYSDGIGPEIIEASPHIIKESGARIENLCTFDGKPSYSLAQGQ